LRWWGTCLHVHELDKKVMQLILDLRLHQELGFCYLGP
jgi:hypothetical protein